MHAHSPGCTSHGIIRASNFEPFSVEAQEISKAARIQVKRVIQKRRISRCCAIDLERVVAQLFEQHGQHECASIVIQAIAFMKVRNRERRMLDNPVGSVICQR